MSRLPTQPETPSQAKRSDGRSCKQNFKVVGGQRSIGRCQTGYKMGHVQLLGPKQVTRAEWRPHLCRPPRCWLLRGQHRLGRFDLRLTNSSMESRDSSNQACFEHFNDTGSVAISEGDPRCAPSCRNSPQCGLIIKVLSWCLHLPRLPRGANRPLGRTHLLRRIVSGFTQSVNLTRTLLSPYENLYLQC